MNQLHVDPRDSAIAHRWRDQLGGVWLQQAPTGHAWKILRSGGFIAFLWAIGHKANADGSNRVPPASRWLAAACGSSKDSVRRYWMAAASLGIVHVEMSPSGRYVRGYTLLMAPAYALDWESCARVLRNDRRRQEQEAVRADDFRRAMAEKARQAIAAQRESARADSPDRNAGSETARADSHPMTDPPNTPPGQASPHVRTPENGTESVGADSRNGPYTASESARADSASPHVAQASPHVRTYQGLPGSYQEMTAVVTQPADPRWAELGEDGPAREDERDWYEGLTEAEWNASTPARRHSMSVV